MSIADAAATNDRRLTLIAMRDKLAVDMDEAPASVVAQVAARLQSVLAELDGIAAPERKSLLDELEQRRTDRLAAAKSVSSAKRPTRQRRTGSG